MSSYAVQLRPKGGGPAEVAGPLATMNARGSERQLLLRVVYGLASGAGRSFFLTLGNGVLHRLLLHVGQLAGSKQWLEDRERIGPLAGFHRSDSLLDLGERVSGGGLEGRQ